MIRIGAWYGVGRLLSPNQSLGFVGTVGSCGVSRLGHLAFWERFGSALIALAGVVTTIFGQSEMDTPPGENEGDHDDSCCHTLILTAIRFIQVFTARLFEDHQFGWMKRDAHNKRLPGSARFVAIHARC